MRDVQPSAYTQNKKSFKSDSVELWLDILNICKLLFESTRPLPIRDIAQMCYRDEDITDESRFDKRSDTTRKRAERALKKLQQIGVPLVITRTNEKLYSLDKERLSFIDTQTIPASTLRIIDLLCSPLLNDPEFDKAGILRNALAKIDSIYIADDDIPIQVNPSKSPHNLEIQLYRKIELKSITSFMYQGRNDEVATRRFVAPFAIRTARQNKRYLIAIPISQKAVQMYIEHGGCELDVYGQIHYYRTDRIQLSVEDKKFNEQQVPFICDDDPIIPPNLFYLFNLGQDEPVVVVYSLEEDSAQEFKRAHAFSELPSSIERPLEWHTTCCNYDAAARFAIENNLVPTSPAAVVDIFKHLISCAGQLQPHADDAEKLNLKPLKPSDGRLGRIADDVDIRSLVSVLFALLADNAVDFEALIQRFGISADKAEQYYQVLEQVHNLPLISAYEDDSVSQTPSDGHRLMLSWDSNPYDHRLRLSSAETHIVARALFEIGYSEEDPLFCELIRTFKPIDSDLADFIEPHHAVRVGQKEMLQTLLQTQFENDASTPAFGISFYYQKVEETILQRRHITLGGDRDIFGSVCHKDGDFYLDNCVDLDVSVPGALMRKTFKVSRMSNLEVFELTDEQVAYLKDSGNQAPDSHELVELIFDSADTREKLILPQADDYLLSDGRVLTRIPYYGGSWLARQVCAYADVCTTSSQALIDAIHKEAKAYSCRLRQLEM